jgi:predicted dehydrogenase
MSPQPDAPLRIGILGCGGFARVHASVIGSVPKAAVVTAVADRNLDRAEALQAESGAASAHGSLAALLDAGVDAVIVCLPPYGHGDEVAEIAAAGTHLLIEKPIALSSSHAWEMVDAAESAGIVTQVGFQLRFGAVAERIVALRDAGSTGPFALFQGRYFCNALHAPWWRDLSRSGGQVVEQVIHQFDLMRHLIGDPNAVFSVQANLFHTDIPGYSAEDLSTTTAMFPSGAVASITATNNAIPGKWLSDFRVVARDLTVDATGPNDALLTMHATPDAPLTIADDARDIRRELFMDFARAIREQRPARVPIREGARSLDVVLAARESSHRREVVAW